MPPVSFAYVPIFDSTWSIDNDDLISDYDELLCAYVQARIGLSSMCSVLVYICVYIYPYA